MTNFWREQIKEKKKMNLFEFVNVIFSLEKNNRVVESKRVVEINPYL